MKNITFFKSFIHEGQLCQSEQKGEIVEIGGRRFYKYWEGGMLGACVIVEPQTGCSVCTNFNEEYLYKEILKRINDGTLDVKISDVIGKYQLKNPINNLY